MRVNAHGCYFKAQNQNNLKSFTRKNEKNRKDWQNLNIKYAE